MINVSDLSMGFGGRSLFRSATFQLLKGHRYGLVGANGTGKTTLLRILAGEDAPDSGVVAVGKDLKVASLKQDQFLYEGETLVNTVLRGNKELWKALQRKEEILAGEDFSMENCDELADLEKEILHQDGYAAESQASQLLVGLGLRNETHHQTMSTLSGGYKLRVLLAQLLFSAPDILLLDEPNNHLDIVSIRWLEGYLVQLSGTVIVSSHDRDFLNRVCTDIADVDYGNVRLYPGNYDKFLETKAETRERNEATLSKHEKRKDDMQEFVDRFGAKASKAKQAQSRVRMIEKLDAEMDQLDLRASSRASPNIRFTQSRPSGVIALRAHGISKSYGERRVLDGITFEVERGEKIGVIGPNGIGKSTLLKILTEGLPVDKGTFEWGHAVAFTYFSQEHDSHLNRDQTLIDWLTDVVSDSSEQQRRNALGRSLFSGDDVLKKIGSLSGGEKARLVLSKMMLQPHNVLVFDEPTNHLDMEAIEALVVALKEYPGTIIFVSHNAYFVSQLANRIFEIQPHGIRDFRGTYPEYLETFSTDFLSKDSARILQVSSPKQEKSAVPMDHEERRRLRNRKNQLKKDVEQSEKRTNELEAEIGSLEAMMAEERFANAPADIEKLVVRKLALEAELHTCVTKWEEAVRALDDIQD